jgi:uroporphyrinogen decarboxylase
MCTEPSAFGAIMTWGENEFPFAGKVLRSLADVDHLEKPDPRKHGLLPFVIKRLRHIEPSIEAAGHTIRFAVTRGPFNVASFLMGTTEFLMALRTDPDIIHRLLALIADFLVDWIAWQRECFPSIDGLLVLDDIIGFVGRRDFEPFGLPSLTRIFATDVTVKFFHNDAPCEVCAPYLAGMGVNLLNFGVQHTVNDMKNWTGHAVTLLGNIPPLNVLANGTPADVTRSVADLLEHVDERSRLIVSCGGGMPPGVPTANIDALVSTVERLSR